MCYLLLNVERFGYDYTVTPNCELVLDICGQDREFEEHRVPLFTIFAVYVYVWHASRFAAKLERDSRMIDLCCKLCLI